MQVYDDGGIPIKKDKDSLEFQQRVSEWIETIQSLQYLITDMEQWYHFCLMGIFFTLSSGKYVVVCIYPNGSPEFQYRCVSYDYSYANGALETGEAVVNDEELELLDMIDKFLWYLDPDNFYPVYVPVDWEMVTMEEIASDNADMSRIDKIYSLSKESEKGK